MNKRLLLFTVAYILTCAIVDSQGDTVSFLGGYSHLNISDGTSQLKVSFDFNRSPSRADGILFVFYSSISPNYFSLVMLDGEIRSIILYSGRLSVHSHTEDPVPAAEWLSLVVNLNRTSLSVRLNGNWTSSKEIDIGINGRRFPGLHYAYVGGLPDAKNSFYPDLPTHRSFHGCMRRWSVGSSNYSFNESNSHVIENSHVASGCCVESVTLCEPQPNPITIPSTCSLSRFNISWSQIEVVGGRLQLTEGRQTALNTGIFKLEFPEDADDVLADLRESIQRVLTFDVILPPKHGVLKPSRHSEETIQQFSFAKLSSILYIHDGTESTRDVIEFQLNVTCPDGFVVLTKNMFVHVVIQPHNDSPNLSHSGILRLAVGTRTTLSRQILNVTDPDSDQNAIQFEVVDVKKGRFEKLDTPGQEINLFLQEELVNGMIAFQHFKSFGSQRFTVFVIIRDEQSSIYKHLSIEPFDGEFSVVNSSCLKVFEDSKTLIQPHTLNVVTNFESQNPQVNFTLESLPIHGFVEVFRNSSSFLVPTWWQLSVGDFFTRKEVQLDRVRYVHNSTLGNVSQFDHFVLKISSYQAEGPSVNQCIEITPQKSLLNLRFNIVTSPLHLREGETAVIDESHINVTVLPRSVLQLLEETTGFESIGVLFNVIAEPRFGSVLMDGSPLNGSTFTLNQLRMGIVSYSHNGSENHEDTVLFLLESTKEERTQLRIPSLEPSIAELILSIQPVNNHAPVVTRLKDITPVEGGSQVIDSSVIDIVDRDGPGDVVTVTVERRITDNGYFAFDTNFSTVVTEFTLRDLRRKSTVFLHSFGAALERPYALSIFDGVHRISRSINVRARRASLNVTFGSDGIKCPFSFDATEQKGYKFSSQSFRVDTDSPRGILEITVSVNRLPYHGRLVLDGTFLQRNQEFSVRSIHNSDFFYDFSQNLTLQTFVDNFTLNFVLGSSSLLVFVPICIIPVPVPRLITSVDSLKILVPMSGIKHITQRLLDATDSRGGLFPERLVYNVTIPPSVGKLVNISEGDRELVRFTQADVNNNHIAYLHKGTEESSNDVFTFKLRNSFVILPPVQFFIDVYRTNLTVIKAGFVLNEGSKHVIASDEFQIYPPPGYDAYIKILTPPHHGSLLYGKTVFEKIGSRVITPRDISLGLLAYEHDDSENSRDVFEFEVHANITDPVTRNIHSGVAGRIGNYRGEVIINITLLNDNPPKVRTTRIIHITIWGGEQVNINSSVLLYHDIDVGDDDNLSYTVDNTTISECGYFFLKNRPSVPILVFEQRSIVSGMLWYQHTRSSRCKDISRIFYLIKVSDGQHVETQVIIVHIEEFLIIPFKRDLVVSEGGQAVITTHHLSASVEGKYDANDSEFLFRIVHPPKWGVLIGNMTSFSLEELKTMNLTYKHGDSDTKNDSFTFIIAVGNFTTEELTFSIQVIPVDDTPPVFEVVEPVYVLEGNRMYFNASVLRASDTEQGPSEITFTPISNLSFGRLYKVLSMHRQEQVDTFTQTDINRELIYYQNEGVPPTWTDNFTVVVADLKNVNLQPRDIVITIVPLILPVRLSPLIVHEFGLIAISYSLIRITHPFYTEDNFTFEIVQPPRRGTVRWYSGKGSVTVFTKMDLVDRNVVYVHDGSESTEDEIGMVVTADLDGKASNKVILPITVIPVNDEKPEMTNQFPILVIGNGDTLTVSPRLFSVTDEDTPPLNLTYNFTTPANKANVAYFTKRTDSNTSINSFTQWDVDVKNILFVHPGNLYNATWPFLVSDGENIIFGNFSIRGIPIYITVTKNVSVSVDMESTTLITSDHLKLETSDGTMRQITFRLLNDCVHGRLWRTDIDRTLQPGDTFTQDDIDRGLILYRHHDMEKWEPSDSFLFDAYVPNAEVFNPASYILAINLRKSNTSRFAVNRPLEVEEGGEVCISDRYLDARNIRYEAWKNCSRDFNISDMIIRFKLLSISFGEIYVEVYGEEISNDIFWQKDDSEYACYRHFGNESTQDLLQIEVSIFPPVNSSVRCNSKGDPEVFVIKVLPVNDEIPTIARSVSREITVVHGFEQTISSSQLAVTDRDNGPEDIVFSITVMPKGGYFIVDGRSDAMEFTQADINQGLVKLKHDSMSLLEDQFSFQFSDGLHFGNGSMSIKVQPHELRYSGSHLLSYTQDTIMVPISNSLLNIWTNGLRSETYYSFISSPTKGTIQKRNISAQVENFSQVDVDNNLLHYIPQDKSSINDSFVVTILNRKQNITVAVEILVEANVRIQPLTLDNVVSEGLDYVLPPELFSIGDTMHPAGKVRLYVLTEPLHGTLSVRSSTTKREVLDDSFSFSYRELNESLIYYLVHKSLQTEEAREVEENFEMGVRMHPLGQLGFLNVSFKVVVPARTTPTTPTSTTPALPGTSSDYGEEEDFSVYIVIPILGMAFVLMVVISIIIGSVVVRYYRLRQRERRRQKLQKAKQNEGKLGFPPTADYLPPVRHDDSSSEGTIEDVQDVYAKSTSGNLSLTGNGQMNRNGSIEYPSPRQQGPNGHTWTEPIAVPIPEKPKGEESLPTYSPRISPEPPLNSSPNSRLSPISKSSVNKEHLKYDTSRIDPNVKKLFRSDHPQLKHVEYWV